MFAHVPLFGRDGKLYDHRFLLWTCTPDSARTPRAPGPGSSPVTRPASPSGCSRGWVRWCCATAGAKAEANPSDNSYHNTLTYGPMVRGYSLPRGAHLMDVGAARAPPK